MRIADLEFERWEREGLELIQLHQAYIWKLKCQIAALVNQARLVRTDTNAEVTSMLMYRLYEAKWLLRQVRATLRAARVRRTSGMVVL